MTISGNKKEQWERSYGRKENHLFYPNEEYVRFLQSISLNGT